MKKGSIKMCKCSPDCIYFPNEVYENGKEAMTYVDAKGVKHFYELPKMCRYDWHSIKEWEQCEHYKDLRDVQNMKKSRNSEISDYPVLVLCGESAAGKDTILKTLKGFGFEDIVSYTTRPIREGEEQDREYHFIDKELFLKMMNKKVQKLECSLWIQVKLQKLNLL